MGIARHMRLLLKTKRQLQLLTQYGQSEIAPVRAKEGHSRSVCMGSSPRTVRPIALLATGP